MSRPSERVQNITVGIALFLGLAIGLFVFNYLPNLLAIQGKRWGIENPRTINLITEIIKFAAFFGYLFLIIQMKEIKRVFRYHGAEHKAINTLESGQALTIENCFAQTRLHPRCGTSFAVIVLIIGAIVFTFMPKPEIEGSMFLTSIARFLVEIPVVFLIAGVAYEIIRLAGRMRNQRWVRVLLWPGLMTQYLTTKVPDEGMIEVALVALRAVVDAEKADKGAGGLQVQPESAASSLS